MRTGADNSAPYFSMKLQILIPQYKETESEIKPLLDSIAIQQNVDLREIGVIICNDGSDTYLSREFLDSYPFRIDYHLEKHRGVSATRNSCFDYSESDYVMWCDADDIFLSVCGLYLIFRYIEMGFDALYSAFLEEAMERDTGKLVYVKRERDATFVHGKVYSRHFLKVNELRWNENLTVHEDCYFNGMCLNIAQNVKYCEDPFYLWKWRADSVCRCDENYRYKTFVNLIDSHDALVGGLCDLGYLNQAVYFMCYSVFETYYSMNKPDWADKTEYREATEKRFAEFFEKYKSMWDTASDKDKSAIATEAREKALKEGMLLESISVFDWLKRRITCQAEGQEKDSAGKR